MIPVWPTHRLGHAIEALARYSGLGASADLNRPPDSIATDDAAASSWIQATASRFGLEVDSLDLVWARLEEELPGWGPALLRLPDGNWIALLPGTRVLAPDYSVKRVKRSALTAILRAPAEAPLAAEIKEFLDEARIPVRSRPAASATLLRERLRDARIGSAWSLRTRPGASFARAASQAGVFWRLGLLAAVHAAEYALWILSWWFVGQGALQGRLDHGWLFAWALLLLTMIPMHAASTWLQGTASVAAGGLLKERLLAGALKLDSSIVRRQGAGHILGRVIESEALESLALNGGFLVLMAAVELVMAILVLAEGAGGVIHAAALAVWTAVAAGLAWRCFQDGREWTKSRLTITHNLVERMAGHRTRLAQERRAQWHHSEDGELDQYLISSRRLDTVSARLTALIPRGWMILGLVVLVPAFVAGSASETSLAIAVGGMLLAVRALRSLSDGLTSLAAAAIAWQQVSSLFKSAAKPELPGLGVTPQQSGEAALLEAQDLTFRHEGRAAPVLSGCSLRIHHGDRIVVEGPSGGGKSTFASLLAGVRPPDAGLLLAGGLDRNTLGADGWRRRVACAPQFHENYLLSGPLLFNLLMGRPGLPTASDAEEAEAVCCELGLSELLARMPGGLMQVVGESGWQLSHGERSRVYMARALLQRADVVVLDESLAALDPRNLRLALDCISRRAKAAVVIAHR